MISVYFSGQIVCRCWNKSYLWNREVLNETQWCMLW